jgi:hypothetical protein
LGRFLHFRRRHRHVMQRIAAMAIGVEKVQDAKAGSRLFP